MNRMGLVDFWCYENEVFEFENGHMLLRGSNGSGKSVTMQSFIPLLLDGNKSSERLDPFGTRSRKMETYLIDENSSREERIGYLYLEFKREDSELYKTIGMGLRARKGKPLDSWYFVIEDNRRIGIDFALMENQLTLSEKQLKNILGDQVIESQKEYMKRVNEALFCFESLQDYGDAIGLLLQLRSPKLSNSLSPQKINEILASSLQPLSDEDLRPMSEAIMNMDNLQDQLELLKQSLQAAQKLKNIYQTYNQVLLLEKWTKYIKEQRLYQQINQNIKQKDKEKKQFYQNLSDNHQKLDTNRIQYEVKTNELSSMKTHDIEAWIASIGEYNQELTQYQKELDKKIHICDQKEEVYQDLNQSIEEYQNLIDQKEYECQKLIQEMNAFNEILSLSEHLAIKECFEQRKKNFEFSYTRQVLQNDMKQIQDGLAMWKDYETQSQLIAFYENDESQKQEQYIVLQTQMEHLQKEYQQVIEEYLEDYHRFNENNEILKISQQDMEKIREHLIDYEMTHDYFVIQKVIDDIYQHMSRQLIEEQMRYERLIQENENELSKLYHEKEYLESLEDLEPQQTPENQLNRQYLDEHHIDYVPFYRLLEFDASLTDLQKQRIEEILSQMQLLNALVVHKNDQYRIQELPQGCQDFYLWTNQDVNQLQTLTISQFNNQNDLLFILECLGIETNQQVVIQDKYFQSGIIEGSLSLNQEAIYIGYESRMKMKQNKIESCLHQIQELEILKEENMQKEKLTKEKQQTLLLEYQSFRDEKQLKESLDDVEILRKEQATLEQKIQELQQLISLENQKLTEIHNQIKVLASKLLLPVQKGAFEAYKDDLQDYQEAFESFKDSYTQMLQTMDLKAIQDEKASQLIDDLDELHYEIEQYQHKISVITQKRDLLQEKLNESGYQDIAQKIQELQNEIKRLEDEKTALEKEKSVLETKIEQVDIDIQNLSDQKLEQENHMLIYKDIFMQEKDLHFIIKEDMSDEDIGKIMRDLNQEFSHKKSIADYQNQLQRVYFEQNIYLNQYNVVQENVPLCHDVDDVSSRLILKATNQGKRISFLELTDILEQNIEIQELLIVDEDRHIFEDILVNTISKKIRERIHASRQWVDKIQSYMNDMNTSSGLQLSLKWKSRKATDDGQLDTQKLVELLEMDYHVLKDSDRKKISNHFRSKINSARKMSQDENTTASFHQLMKDVMDYRQWFDFTLYAKKPNENRKELTSHVFYAYSGGEKALSMYVPLFSAVAAKFESARKDAPLLIALDEAFAGVDENNIDNMFALITKFGFDYIMNSQVLWGDYPSCLSLAIYELFRPNNAPFVTVIAYIWNGKNKRLKYS